MAKTKLHVGVGTSAAKRRIILALVALAYWVLALDIIRDGTLIIGRVDDYAVLTTCLVLMAKGDKAL